MRRSLHLALLRLFRVLPRRVRLRVVHTLSPTFTVGAVCVIERADGAVLLVRHSYRQRWGLPGGLLERGEEADAGARREAARRTRAFERVDLAEVAREVIELTRPRWELEAQARGVTYEFGVEGVAPPVAGRPEELREVLTNLITNAVDAMPAGGVCRVRLDTAGEWALMAVTDTGIGMAEDMRRRVFEPFFTSKGPRGTGLGLAVAWGIVTRHGGSIEVESAPGQGTTFRVRLPVPVALPDVVVGLPVTLAPRPARLLLIEDETEVQAVLAEMLREAGYGVAVAKDGLEGIELCEREPIDVVLSDISMPGISGWDVAARLRARHPHLPIGFVTGWGDQLDPDRLAGAGVDFVVAKPFQAHDILRHVAQALLGPRVNHTARAE